MLAELRVRDLGIIEDIDWKLDAGLNVITGETGAGKSLVIDAVELLLVGSASEDIVRHGANEAHIEGVFFLPQQERLASLKANLEEKGLADDEALVIAGEIRRQRPAIFRINGQTVSRSILRQTGQLLIDIHGQSEHLSLLNKKYHVDFLDAYGHTAAQRHEFATGVVWLRELEAELESLAAREKDRLRQEEFLAYQIDEIKKAQLRPGEDEELEKERHIISHSEKLKEHAGQAYRSVYGGDGPGEPASALSRLADAQHALRKLSELDQSLKPQLDELEKSMYALEDIAREIRSYDEELQHDPGRLEEIESRLEMIRNLKRKYGQTIPAILEYLKKAESDLSEMSEASAKGAELEKEKAELKSHLAKQAAELSQQREEAARDLEARVKKELNDLEMSQMRFTVSITRREEESGLRTEDGRAYAFGSEGIDEVEFMAATNPGEPSKPLAKIASTGEISRFTLALKGALSETDNVPVLIFDEIDIGVGGRSGDVLGRKLWALAQNHQVVCVTHLPQVAAYADAHFCVHKETSQNRTTSKLENLEGDARIDEMAAMLGGPGYTQTTRSSAKEILQKAEKWKKSHQLKF